MIKAIITDFDGTLVDTFEANLRAYQKSFAEVGLVLTPERYRECFGYRYDRFMQEMDVTNKSVANRIKELKKQYYPEFFEFLRPNTALIQLISSFKTMGGKTAIASTARKENLMNAVNHLDIAPHFDLIFAGIDVKQGKPDPEIYIKTMETLGVVAEETLIFEDSEIGIDAAKASGARFIRVTPEWFEK